MDGRELLTVEQFERDDLVAGVDHLIGRRGVGGAERPKLVARLGERRRRPQRSGEQGECKESAAHQVTVNGGLETADNPLLPPANGRFKAGLATCRPAAAGGFFGGQTVVGHFRQLVLPTGISQYTPR